MKTTLIIRIIAGIAILLAPFALLSQNRPNETKTFEKKQKPKITVLNIDTKGIMLDSKGPAVDPVMMGNLVRVELTKIDTFEVMDKYDATYLIEKNKLKIENCYGKLCLVELARIIKADKMFTGSVEVIGQSILVTMRLIDVKEETIEKTQVIEFLNIPEELPNMLAITIRKMFGLHNDDVIVTKLTKRYDYESLLNNPREEQLCLTGTRMGFTVLTGGQAQQLAAKRSDGGFDIQVPVMFQFGYQFEKQYLNAGQAQALFEFIPMITGLDHGMLIPSITFMNGIRDNRHGWEFAFGPTTSAVTLMNVNGTDRMDSRGTLGLSWGFVFAFGKTYKSGKLNIPFNVFVIPNNDGIRFGASFGFNAKNK